jgi:TM2 domain-containing membrane protein YozV
MLFERGKSLKLKYPNLFRLVFDHGSLKSIVTIFSLVFICFGGDVQVNAVDTITNDPQPDSTGSYISVPRQLDETYQDSSHSPVHNPVIAGGLAAIFPGAGHIYLSTGRCEMPWRRGQIIRGSLYLVSQAITSGVMVNRIEYYKYLSGVVNDSLNALKNYTPAGNTDDLSTEAGAIPESGYNPARMNYEITRYERRTARYSMYQSIGWNIGLYAFNIMSATGYSGYFKNDDPKNPYTAGWLSAIPILGLGQIYNGAISKTGMIWMVETNLFFMAYNYNRLMNDCIKQRDNMADSTDWRFNYRELTISGTNTYDKDWEGKYDDAFHNRNLYLWYGVFFYFYGIFDAVVDAHLHDYKRKIRMEPVLDIKGDRLGVCLSGELYGLKMRD